MTPTEPYVRYDVDYQLTKWWRQLWWFLAEWRAWNDEPPRRTR